MVVAMAVAMAVATAPTVAVDVVIMEEAAGAALTLVRLLILSLKPSLKTEAP
nr:hypothetical protein [Acinetobacter baumannii]